MVASDHDSASHYTESPAVEGALTPEEIRRILAAYLERFMWINTVPREKLPWE